MSPVRYVESGREAHAAAAGLEALQRSTLRLAALEFIVDKAAWDAHHAQPPQLFRGAPFDLTGAPNRFGLDPFYSQHVWFWKPNPAGMLTMWNPRVHCPATF